MILSLNPGMSYSVEENNVSLGQIKKKKKKKKTFCLRRNVKKRALWNVFFFFVLFGLVFCFLFVFFFVCFCCCCFRFNAKSPATIFPLFSQFCFFSFCFVLFWFWFWFSKNWENYCEQVSKNLGGGGEGKRWKAQFKSNACDLLRLKCLFVCFLFGLIILLRCRSSCNKNLKKKKKERKRKERGKKLSRHNLFSHVYVGLHWPMWWVKGLPLIKGEIWENFVFIHQVLKLAFLSSLTEKYILCRGFQSQFYPL